MFYWYIKLLVLTVVLATFLKPKTRIEEHIEKDNKSSAFKHLHFNRACGDSHKSLSFKMIVKTDSRFHLKIKVAL